MPTWLPYLGFFLLPVVAASSWYLARRNIANNSGTPITKRSNLSNEYFRGLSYLINEQPDKAIEVFIRMLEDNPETVETHLALGALFRRRGEVSKAIGIHQNLIARVSLSSEQRSNAMLELGLDYMRAGLLDRAEHLFREILAAETHQIAALKNMLAIYQQEKEWHKAIDTIRKLEVLDKDHRVDKVLAHYYCEIAEELRREGDLEQANAILEDALLHDIHCARASILQAELATMVGNHKRAVQFYKKIEQQQQDFIPEIINPLLQSYQKIAPAEEIINYLRHLLDLHQGTTVLLAITNQISLDRGEKKAAEFLTEQLRIRPSVRGLDQLIKLTIANADGVAQQNLLGLRNLAEQLLERKPIYQCSNCGFQARLLHWQCPGCKSWDMVKPIQGVEGE